MKEITEEIEGSHLGGAEPPYNLDDLSTNIRDIRKLVTKFCDDPTEGEKTNEMFICSLLGLLDKTNEQLSAYKEDLKQNKCIEPFKVSSERNNKGDKEFWMFIDMLFEEFKHLEVYQSLKDKVTRFRSLLAEVENAMRHCDPIVFEKFFFRVKPGDVEEGAVQEFHRKIYENLPITSEKLMVIQSQAVIDAIGKGIFDHAGKASWDEVKKVSPDLATDYVPCDFEITDDFKKKYALFRRYTYKRGVVLVLNYGKYGKYIADHKYEFKDKQFKAIYELDVMLREIRLEMERRYPELLIPPVTTIKEQPDCNQPVAGEPLSLFIHPSLDDEEGWKIHNELIRLVRRQSLADIIKHLRKLESKNIVLMPIVSSVAYDELVRLGMPNTGGFSKEHFRKQYFRKDLY